MGQRASRDSLRRFLSEHVLGPGLIVEPDSINRLMDLLEPFFVRAESGGYQLAPEAELDPEQVRAAIAQATGQKITRVVFVSRSHPFPKPPWMTEKVFRACFEDSLWDSLWDCLWASFEDDGQKDTPGASIRAKYSASLGASLKTNFWDSLFYLLGFALISRTGKEERLVPLVELLPKAIPLGIKRGEPGVWIVLAA